jgi:hypothetical protein
MYKDLPLGLNLVENPSFEDGISNWRTSGQWLSGSVSTAEWTNSFAHSLKRSFYVSGAAPSSAGMGGMAYDFDTVLPAGTYDFSIWVYLQSTVNQTIVIRAGRSDIAVPGIIGTVAESSGAGPANTWTHVSGSFTSDGIYPTSIIVRNEHASNYGYFAIDDVAVIPQTSAFQLDLYNQMMPVADQDAVVGYPLKRFLRAYSLMFDQVENYARDANDGTPGWARLANPMTTPSETLDWLAQIGGTKVPFGTKTPDKRILIRDAPGRERGTRNAIIKAVQAQLTGTKYVAFLERSTDNDHFSIGVLKSESPVSDWAGTNVVANPSMEVNTTGWNTTASSPVVSGATFVRETGDTYSGLWTGKVQSGGTNQGVWYDLGILPAGSYQFIVALRNYGPGVATAIDYGLVGSLSTFSVTPLNSWALFGSTTAWVSDGVTASRIHFRPGAFNTNWIDALAVIQTTVPLTEYVEGPATTIIKDAVEEARSVEFRQDDPVFLENAWSYYAINASIIAVGDEITYLPTYDYYRDVKRHFTTYDDLKNNTPHTWENILGDYHDPNNEKSVGYWVTNLFGSLINGGSTITQDASVVFKDSTAGRLTTTTSASNQGMILDLQSLGLEEGKTYSVNIFLQAITTSAPIQVWAGPTSSPTLIYSGTIPAGSWTQVQGQFVAGSSSNYLTVLVPGTLARTVNFDMYAMTQGIFTFPSSPASY